MRNVLLGIVVLALFGCGRPQDPELSPYISEFVDIVKTVKGPAGAILDTDRAKGLQITFSDKIPAGYFAWCSSEYTLGVRQYEVRVSRPDWDGFNESLRRLVIFHELSHCVLGLEHDPDPHSYMASNPYYAEFSGFSREQLECHIRARLYPIVHYVDRLREVQPDYSQCQ